MKSAAGNLFKLARFLRMTLGNPAFSFGIKHLVQSRIIILAIIFLTQASSDLARGKAGQYMNLNGSIHISNVIQPSPNILKADIGWYKGIADHGYDARPFSASPDPSSQKNWAFFPGWPIIWRLCGLGRANSLSGIITANILYITGMVSLFKYLKKSSLSQQVNYKSFFLIASYYPFGYFFSLPLPESLFTACTGLFLLTIPTENAKPSNTILNILTGYLSGLTRPTGIFNSIFPIAELCKVLSKKERCPKKLLSLIASSASPFLGLGSFMTYLYFSTGNPMAFKDIQIAWGRTSGFPLKGLATALSPNELVRITHYSNFRLANIAICILMLYCIVALLKKSFTALANGNQKIATDLKAMAIYLLMLVVASSSDNQSLLSFARIAGANTIFFAALSISIKGKYMYAAVPALAMMLGAFSALAIVGFDAFAA